MGFDFTQWHKTFAYISKNSALKLYLTVMLELPLAHRIEGYNNSSGAVAGPPAGPHSLFLCFGVFQQRKSYLERSVKEAEDNIREMLMARRAQ